LSSCCCSLFAPITSSNTLTPASFSPSLSINVQTVTVLSLAQAQAPPLLQGRSEFQQDGRAWAPVYKSLAAARHYEHLTYECARLAPHIRAGDKRRKSGDASVRPSFDWYSVTRRKLGHWWTDSGNHTAVLTCKQFNRFRGLDLETGRDIERKTLQTTRMEHVVHPR
jgi:hypothetical protein